tara:strand:- start:1999 stop:2847 length:849 start_codon:yes stop_codon:yes gene_type:complete
MNIFVTGANGQLGQTFRHLCHSYKNFTFYFKSKNEINIEDLVSVENFVIKKHINLIINCAAFNNVECNDLDRSNLVNHIAVSNLASICKRFNIKLVHFSSDYIFDGLKKSPYKETSIPNPINNYGISKLMGEKAILKICPSNFIIIRTSWVYSNISGDFVSKMLKKFNFQEKVQVVSDQIGSPTYTYDLAEFVLLIIPKLDNIKYNIYNFTNKGECSWFDFAKEILNLSNNTNSITAVKTSFFNSTTLRPKYSKLCTSRVEKEFNFNIPFWYDSLRNCLNNS